MAARQFQVTRICLKIARTALLPPQRVHILAKKYIKVAPFSTGLAQGWIFMAKAFVLIVA
ncbi:MAG: hypothetical protein KME30_31375 [Iphinoe sp. HA4291-MV1]|nr:hypothetical protein [Iphinoe sp. HA4291-MV1]